MLIENAKEVHKEYPSITLTSKQSNSKSGRDVKKSVNIRRDVNMTPFFQRKIFRVS